MKCDLSHNVTCFQLVFNIFSTMHNLTPDFGDSQSYPGLPPLYYPIIIILFFIVHKNNFKVMGQQIKIFIIDMIYNQTLKFKQANASDATG